MGDAWIPVLTTLVFFIVFVILHWTSPYIIALVFGKRHLEAYENLPTDTHRTYWRRLVRSEIYYIYAGFIGTILMITEYRSVDELIFKYHRFFEINMCIALAHWVSAFDLIYIQIGLEYHSARIQPCHSDNHTLEHSYSQFWKMQEVHLF